MESAECVLRSPCQSCSLLKTPSSTTSSGFWLILTRALKRQRYYETFDFFVLQSVATKITTHHLDCQTVLFGISILILCPLSTLFYNHLYHEILLSMSPYGLYHSILKDRYVSTCFLHSPHSCLSFIPPHRCLSAFSSSSSFISLSLVTIIFAFCEMVDQ